ncbi:MAG: stage II sporulation protein M [Clostridia bacterium]|nr:stage II sporulation protein M [Clostridia bacterium]
MQKGTVVSLKHFKSVIDFLKQNWRMILLTLFFIVGIVLATVSLDKSGYLFERLNTLSVNYISLRQGKDFFKIFSNSFLNNAVFLTVIFILGSSINGITLVPLVIGVKGYITGYLIAFIYSTYELKGIALSTLIVIPPAVISIIFLFIFSKFAIGFSLQVICLTLPNTSSKNLSLHFKQYLKQLLITFIPIIFAAVFDGWLSTKLISHFEF